MGHSTLIIEAMKVTLVLCATLALASSQGCPELAPVTCGKDMMNCPGMNDVNGCPTAGSCMPTKGGSVGTDGVACPVMCSSALHPCGADMMACPVMGPNGCQQPDLCLPAKGAMGTDGTECTVMCPTAPCGKDMIQCPGVSDNGCPMPHTCMPTKGGPVGTDNVACPVTCPQAPCPKEMVGCPQTSSNGCTMPELCMPATSGCPT